MSASSASVNVILIVFSRMVALFVVGPNLTYIAPTFLSHKIALDPNAAQGIYFARAAGTARFAWIWALAEWQSQYKAGGKPTEVSLRRRLNAIKHEQFLFMFDVTKCAATTSRCYSNWQ